MEAVHMKDVDIECRFSVAQNRSDNEASISPDVGQWHASRLVA